MTKDEKEVKGQEDEERKDPRAGSGTECSCDCGCIPPPVKS